MYVHEMGSLTCVLVLLCILSVSSKSILGTTADRALSELRVHKPGFKIPEIPDPAQIIIIILRNYCQLLIEQGVANLPNYCYTLPPSQHINPGYTIQGSNLNPSDGGIGRVVA